VQKKERIFLSPPHMSGNEQTYIKEAFNSNWIAPLGNNVDGFERELAQYNGVKQVEVFNSGTAAIHLALRLLDVRSGDTVFCSSLTFVASVNPIIYQGGTPVLIDSETDTWNMSPQALKRALEDAQKQGKLPKAIIVVHLYGQSAKMDELLSIANAYGVPIVEDAAESLGSTYKGQKSGTLGKFGIFSFNGNKIITTSGGGALVSNDEKSLDKAKFLATQARDPASHYQHSEVGYNYRMSNILSGIGRAQLEVLDLRVAKRRAIFNTYYQALGDVPGLVFQPELADTKSNRWLTTLTVDPEQTGITPEEIIEKMTAANIEVRPVWKPMHLQPLFTGATYYPHEEGNSVSDQLFEHGICLPSGTNMSDEDQQRVINQFKELLMLDKKMPPRKLVLNSPL